MSVKSACIAANVLLSDVEKPSEYFQGFINALLSALASFETASETEEVEVILAFVYE